MIQILESEFQEKEQEIKQQIAKVTLMNSSFVDNYTILSYSGNFFYFIDS